MSKQAESIYYTARVHPNQITVIRQYTGCHKSNSACFAFENDSGDIVLNSKFLHSKRTAEGKLSDIAKRKLKRAIDYMLFISQEKKARNLITGKQIKFKVNFVTLTLCSAQIHSDKEITNLLLNQFLIEMKTKFKLKNYIYRAEKQKNGNIHYHILMDIFVWFTDIRDIWNRIQNKLGYVDRYSEEQRNWHKSGFKPRPELYNMWPLEQQKKAYKQGLKSNFTRPNSTDIHSLKKIRNVRAYLLKYMSKEETINPTLNPELEEKLKVQGRLWACSHNFNNISGLKVDVDNFIEELLSRLKRSGLVRIFEDAYFSIYYFDIKELMFTPFESLFHEFVRYLGATFGCSYQISLA